MDGNLFDHRDEEVSEHARWVAERRRIARVRGDENETDADDAAELASLGAS